MHTQRQLNMWHKWCHNSTVKDSFYGQTSPLPISKRETKISTSYNIQNQSWLQDCHVRREEFQWNGWDGSQIAWGQEGIGGEQWDLSLERDTVNTPMSCDTHTPTLAHTGWHRSQTPGSCVVVAIDKYTRTTKSCGGTGMAWPLSKWERARGL